MKTKLEMAHDYAMIHMAMDRYKDVDDLEMVQWANDYVDALEADADKSKVSGVPDAILTKDQNGKCAHLHTTFGRGECFDCGESLRKRP